MRKGAVKTNLIIVLGSVAIAVASIVFNYRINYQERLKHAEDLLVNSAYLDLAEWLKKGFARDDRDASLWQLQALLREHLHIPNVDTFSAVLDEKQAVIASIALPEEVVAYLEAKRGGTNGRIRDIGDFVMMSLWPEGVPYQLLIGFSKASIADQLAPMLWSTIVFVSAALLLYSLLVIGTVKYTVIEPLVRFLEKGIQVNIEGIVSGASPRTETVEPPAIAPPELAEQFARSMQMLDTWARHKANLDKFITVSISENDKQHLVQNLFQTLKNEFPIRSLTVFEINHSANRLAPIFTSHGKDFPNRLLSEPQGCYVYRSGTTLIQDVGERYCQECKLDANESLICRPLAAGGKQIGVCHIIIKRGGESTRSARTMVEGLNIIDAFLEPYIDLLALGLSNLLLLDSYRNQAVTDGLTGLYNRRYIVEYLTSLLNLAKRNDEPLSLFILDIDNFKRLNDEYGHTAGDEVLKVVAHTIRRSVRDSDTVARYGGEEFVVVLPETDSRTALDVAERVRMAVATIEWDEYALSNIPQVTTSVGVALFPLHGYSHYHLINASDQALYAAKRAGKNRVMLHRELPDLPAKSADAGPSA